MVNQDRKMIISCLQEDVVKQFEKFECDHPLDETVREKLKDLSQKISETADDFEIFKYRKDTDALWEMLLEKAIKCLRFYDTREPFKDSTNHKQPLAYGIKELRKYYDQYADFERILYGSSRHYRDHVIHVLRTWLSGMELLVRNDGKTLQEIKIENREGDIALNEAEKISIWTIISLSHDLGYPLQKSKDIIAITQKMLSSFISNPDISVDFAFHGVQNYMNDFVVRLMSSKMVLRRKEEKKNTDGTLTGEEDKFYVARLQPKYYFKFQKSLERNNHGILSTLIIYKLLTYFLESDYNINEDYEFNEEERRQFYIRREILRAIASHTCNDVYQMYMGSFSFLLRICDDTQEWGRKNISELYVQSSKEYELDDIDLTFDCDGDTKNNQCEISERITILDQTNVLDLIDQFYRQACDYVTIFRDGQETSLRDFSFVRCQTIKLDGVGVKIELRLSIDKNKASDLTGEFTLTSTKTKNALFGRNFSDELKKKIDSRCEYILLDKDGTQIEDDEKNAPKWRKAKLQIALGS